MAMKAAQQQMTVARAGAAPAKRSSAASPATRAAPAPMTGKDAAAMQTWNPHNNKMFELFSYLPPLSDEQIMKQVDYMLNNGWVPCIEFEDPERAFTDTHGYINSLDSHVQSGYYDNRLWPMWKLPMFGSKNSGQVLEEINNCKKANPNCFVRLMAFDPDRQVQISQFLVARPESAQGYFRTLEGRRLHEAS